MHLKEHRYVHDMDKYKSCEASCVEELGGEDDGRKIQCKGN